LLAGLAGGAAGAEAPVAEAFAASFRVEVPYLQAGPEIDGRIEEAAWEQAVLLTDLRQFEPEQGAPASERTEARLAYDEARLYIGIRCHDSEPRKVVANAMFRDAYLGNDDYLEILLDTFHDRQNAFVFSVNPLAAQVDGLVRNEGSDVNYNWDGVWEAEASRDQQGWTVEIAIPFKTLRFARAAEQTWGFNLHRSIPRKRENLLWKPMARTSGNATQYQVSQFGDLVGIRDVEPGRNLQVTPYGLSTGEEATGESRRATGDAGVDLKFNLLPGLVADLTYNTDFAEAEADHQQINLTRFKLFFPEKRGFFLEGASLFYFGERSDFLRPAERIFFFSRQIGLSEEGNDPIPILGGAKVSGKVGPYGVGFLNLTSEATTLDDGQGGSFSEPRTNFTVLRLTRDVFKNSSIGLIGLAKEVAGGGDNAGLGADWNFALGDHFQTGGFLSRTRTPDRTGDDWAGQLDAQWDSDRFFSHVTYTEVGEDFNPEMGFFTRLGVREWRSVFSYQPRPKFWDLRQLYIFNELDYITDSQGEVQTRSSRYEVDIIFNNAAYIALKYFDNWDVLGEDFEIHPGVIIPRGSYRFDNYFVGVQTIPSLPYLVFARYQQGDFYDGTLATVIVGARIRPATGLFSRLYWERNDVALPGGSFTTNLYTARIEYAWSPRLSTNTLIQWNEDDNASLKAVGRWTFRPGSDLYLVYDDSRELPRTPRSPKERALSVKLRLLIEL
jgi:hypothetical protein